MPVPTIVGERAIVRKTLLRTGDLTPIVVDVVVRIPFFEFFHLLFKSKNVFFILKKNVSIYINYMINYCVTNLTI